MPESKTICWNCANACTSKCSWSSDLIPVDGWDAVENGNGFLVKSCPKFRKDTRERNPAAMDTSGCLLLVEKLLEITRDDYAQGGVEMRKQIERFMRGHGASKVHMIADPEPVIESMKGAAVEFKLEKLIVALTKTIDDKNKTIRKQEKELAAKEKTIEKLTAQEGR